MTEEQRAKFYKEEKCVICEAPFPRGEDYDSVPFEIEEGKFAHIGCLEEADSRL